jgi:hypothetical protein
VSALALIPGDVLLHHNRGAVSDLIRLVDGSEYSHASLLHDPGHVAEATAHGVRMDSLAAALARGAYADSYRLVTGPPTLSPVIERADTILVQGDRYAYEQIVLLAVLCTTRRIPLPPEARTLLRTLLDAACRRLVQIVAANKEPMICSEFVFRCFDVDSYRIRIGALAPRAAQSRASTAARAHASRGIDAESLVAVAARLPRPLPRAAHVATTASEAVLAADDIEVEAQAARYLHAVQQAPATPWLTPEEVATDPEIEPRLDRFVGLAHAARSDAVTGTTHLQPRAARYAEFAAVVADFVTPADLSTSPSLYRAGRV